MEADFWHQVWQDNQTGFHLDAPNPMLVSHFSQLPVTAGDTIFVPLCGKTLDIPWLLSQGVHVIGVELSQMAIDPFFEGLGLSPSIRNLDGFRHYQAERLDIFVGDFFELSSDMLGPVDAVYDRAALVALPLDMRANYTAQLKALTQCAPQLLITFEYDQSEMPGPPFSVTQAEIEFHYCNEYQLLLLESLPVAGGLKGICPAIEKAWLLT